MAPEILVLGRTGQVAAAIAASPSRQGNEVACLPRQDADLSRPGHASDAIEHIRPALVINAAAYTAVDKAESEPEIAFRINAEACGEIAETCQKLESPLLHISTDYVFDGEKPGPYVETDQPNPINVYGASKLKGEELVLSRCEQSAVLRISWVYSSTGSNFVKTMLRLGREKEQLSIVNDQIGAPSYAPDVADALLHIARRALEGDPFQSGIFHMSGGPLTNWFEFAGVIFAEGRKRDLTGNPALEGIPTSSYPTPARRPLNSALDPEKLQRTFGIEPPDWRLSLSKCLDQLENSR